MTDAMNRYRILESLGKGGMGEVFLAEDTTLGRKVALKFLLDGLLGDPESRERFHREARAAAALDHPFICKIYEVTEIEGKPCIAMEYIVGQTLEARIAREPLSAQRVFDIGAEIAEALDEAHKRHIVHRDLKPANIMLTEQGHVKVMDFGLARHFTSGLQTGDLSSDRVTQSGVWVGTPAYMSPEQVRGEKEIDGRSDIFSFGTLVYELLGGVHPFRRATPVQTMSAILEDEPSSSGDRLNLVSDSVRMALRKMVAKAPADRYQTFGEVRADIVRLSAVTSSPAVAPYVSDATPVPTPVRRGTFVGREAELGQLRQALEQAIEGRGSVVVIGGEPGVGKTRLGEQLIAEARARGCLTFVCHCYETEGTAPFIPFVELLEQSAKVVPRQAFRDALGDAAPEVARIMPELRRIFPDLAPPVELPSDQQRRFLFNAFQEFMDRATRVMPIVLVLEDLHWGDEPTLLLTAHMAQHVGTLPLLVVGTYRDVELDVTRPFAKILEGLLRERQASRIALRRLPEAEVETMLEALSGQPPPAGLARLIYRETEGNPFFIEEVFQHLKEEGRLFDESGGWRTDLRIEHLQVPEGVRLVIGRRLERVDEDTLRTLTVASVIGRNFDLRLLESASNIEGDALLDALEEAEKAQLISSASSRSREIRYTFAHELIRQTLVSNLSLPRRQRLHLRLAEAIETIHGGAADQDASSLAHHLYQAGLGADAGKTLRYLTLAGEQALDKAAFEEALSHFDRALSLEEAADATLRADLLTKRGHAFRSLGERTKALGDWQEALPLYEAAESVEAVARVCVDTAFQLAFEGNPDQAVEVCRRGLRLVGDHVSADRCRLGGAAGIYLAMIGRHDEATALLTQSKEMAGQLSDSRLLGELLASEARLCWYRFDISRAAETSALAADTLRPTGERWNLGTALYVGQLALWLKGRPGDVVETDRRLRTLAERVGHRALSMVADATHGPSTLMLTGDLPQYEAFARRALEDWKRVGQLDWMAYLYLGTALFWQGRWQEAIDVFEEATNRDPWKAFEGWTSGALFWGKAYSGQHEDALRFWNEKKSDLPELGIAALQGRWGMTLFATEALAVLGERRQAHALYPFVMEVMAKGATVHPVGGLVSGFAAISAAAGEQWDTAQGHFETALREAHEVPHKIAQPDVRRWYAWMLNDRNEPGDRDKARTLLDEAIELYRTLGMPKHVEMAERMSGAL